MTALSLSQCWIFTSPAMSRRYKTVAIVNECNGDKTNWVKKIRIAHCSKSFRGWQLELFSDVPKHVIQCVPAFDIFTCLRFLEGKSVSNVSISIFWWPVCTLAYAISHNNMCCPVMQLLMWLQFQKAFWAHLALLRYPSLRFHKYRKTAAQHLPVYIQSQIVQEPFIAIGGVECMHWLVVWKPG